MMDAEKRFSRGAEQRVIEHGLTLPSRRMSLQHSLGSDSTLLSSIHEPEGPPREIYGDQAPSNNANSSVTSATNSKTRWKSLPGNFHFQHRNSYYYQRQHQNNHSGRSMASSITFSEVDSSINDDDASTEFYEPIDPFLEVNHHLDSQPGIPQRRQSTMSRLTSGSRSNSNSPMRDRKEGTNNDHHFFNQFNVMDNQPGMPQRRQSAMSALSMASSDLEALIASTTAGINHVGLDKHDLGDADAAPTRPTRLQSVIDGASSNGGCDLDAINELVATYNNSNHGMSTKRFTVDGLPQVRELVDECMRSSATSSSASTTTEPVPDYLQQDYTTEVIRNKLAELSASAAIFRTIVNIQDRKYGIRQYKKCFVGSEAVDAMLQAGLASTRTEAVELGRSWMTYLGLFQHVCASHIFKDKYLFYRFNNPPSNTVAGAMDLCWKDGSTCQSRSMMEDHSSSCESKESSSGGGGAGIKEEKYKKSLILTSLRRQSRQKSRHSAPWYSLRQRPTIMEEGVIDEYE